MTQDDVQQAAERLEQAGEAVSVRSVRQALGYGSFRDIAQHLHTLHGEGLDVPAEPPGGEEGEDAHVLPVCTEVGLAPIAHDEAVDVVAEAEGAAQRAKQRLQEAESRVPELERQVAELRQQVLETGLRLLACSFTVSEGALPSDDRGVHEAKQAMWEASRAHREAAERLAQAPQVIAAARGAVRIAEQQLYLAQHHPELVQELASLEAQKPEAGSENSYREWAIWKQSVDAVRAEMAQVIREAGLS